MGQQRYMRAIQSNTVTIGVGPAGTGKTYLAVAAAVAAFRERTVNRIILTRPAVEAGERLGFLPGDLQNKVDPYLRPLYDALYDMLGQESYARLQEKGVIEVAPMAYMRGRTRGDADNAACAKWQKRKPVLSPAGEIAAPKKARGERAIWRCDRLA